MIKYGILCGLVSEARMVENQPGALIGCSAARPARARELARQMVRQGARGLLSFGLAGGLQPHLEPGKIIIGTAVESKNMPRGGWFCDEAWSAYLCRICCPDASGPVWATDTMVTRTETKARIFQRTGALIADMESQAVAEAATAAKIPFAVVRVVADTAAMDLPSAAQTPLLDDGRVDFSSVFKDIFHHPAQLPDLIRLARSTGKAMQSLRFLGKLDLSGRGA